MGRRCLAGDAKETNIQITNPGKHDMHGEQFKNASMKHRAEEGGILTKLEIAPYS